jgi:hypothetical protein
VLRVVHKVHKGGLDLLVLLEVKVLSQQLKGLQVPRELREVPDQLEPITRLVLVLKELKVLLVHKVPKVVLQPHKELRERLVSEGRQDQQGLKEDLKVLKEVEVQQVLRDLKGHKVSTKGLKVLREQQVQREDKGLKEDLKGLKVRVVLKVHKDLRDL